MGALRIMLMMAVGIGLSGCARHQDAPETAVALPGPFQVDVEKNQVYSPPDWPATLRADVYRPRPGGVRPAVLVVHGGGWERRSRHDMADIARTLAQHGLVAVNVDYRFAPQARFPAQIKDLVVAMDWIRSHPRRLGIDPQSIGALGYSSGAHLVALLATAADNARVPEVPEWARPAAVVAGGTPTDLRKYPGGRLVPQFLGGQRDEIPDTFAAASPVTHVDAADPPFFLFHGTLDQLVPLDHATDFRDALHEAGVHCELYQQRWRGHVTAFLLRGGAMTAAQRFLHRQLNSAE